MQAQRGPHGFRVLFRMAWMREPRSFSVRSGGPYLKGYRNGIKQLLTVMHPTALASKEICLSPIVEAANEQPGIQPVKPSNR